MKIGILTLLGNNFGGLLQAYALQTTMERMGHEVVVLYSQKPLSLPFHRMPVEYFRRAVRKYVKKQDNKIFAEQYINKTLPIIQQNTSLFLNKYIHCVDSLKQMDAIVVGSDQVWRYAFYPTTIETYFLSFARNWDVKRIAYAASFGVDYWEYSTRKEKVCAQLALLFDGISVREDSGVELCKKHLNVDASHVLDPTLLLDADDYLFDGKKADDNKYVYFYFLGDTEEKRDFVNRIAHDRGLPLHSAYNPNVNNDAIPLCERVQGRVEDWVDGFRMAEFVVTDSFHGCVFSILHKKQFVAIGHKAGGMARFHSLLKMFSIEDRLVTSFEDYKRLSTIDYDDVYARFAEWRKSSIGFLNSVLNQ